MTQKTMPEERPSEISGAAINAGANDPERASVAPGAQPDRAASDLRDGLATGARELGTEVKHVATEVAGEAKKAAESKLDAGRDFAAEHLGSVAHALRKTSRELRSSESAVTEYVDTAASSVEKLSGYIQTRTLSQLMGDAESFAKREPAVFLGGAFFLGMLGGRFLKSASPASPQTSGPNRSPSAQPHERSSSATGVRRASRPAYGSMPAYSPSPRSGESSPASTATPNAPNRASANKESPATASTASNDALHGENGGESAAKPGAESGAKKSSGVS
jgi:hypothetical protein